MSDLQTSLHNGVWHATMAQNLELWRSILADERYADRRRLERFGAKYYSQGDEDGILLEILRRLSIEHASFVEIGVGNGLENNTVLLLKAGGRGLWVEGDAANAAFIDSRFSDFLAARRLILRHAIVTAENADAIIAGAGVGPDVDVLGVDIDGNDYYVLRAMQSLNPKIVTVEYNSKFPPPIRWRIPYAPDFRWDGSDFFGASLQSFDDLLSERGYSLVGCNVTGANAFFVRNDLANDEIFHPPFTALNHYHPPRYFLVAGLFTHIGGHRADPRAGIGP